MARQVTNRQPIGLAVMNHNRGSSGQAEDIVTTRERCGQYKIALPPFADKVAESSGHWVWSAGGWRRRAMASVVALRFG